jgi:glutamyl/glutaminyl-tRNA synthetase
VARRSGQPAGSLYPLAIGRATLAACRAAYDRWAVHADADLAVYLDAALRALAEAQGKKLGQVAQPLRAALTGSTTRPPIDATAAALGREETLARIAAVAG